MADNKKSFVLYSDLENQIDLLTDDEAGRLFRHILAYVNDRNPEFKKEDRLLAVSFEPIKQQLKRDLKKFEKTKEDRSSNGVIGNLKRWHLDLHELYEKGEISLETAKNIASQRVKSHSDNSDRGATLSDNKNRKATSSDKKNSKASQTVANIADNVNDNVNDNDNVSVNDNIIKEKEIDKEKTKTFSSTTSASDFKKMEEVMNSILEDQNTLLEIGGVAKIPNPKDIPELIKEFFKYQKLVEKIHLDRPNFKKHFVTWYSSRYPNNSQNKNYNSKNPQDGPRFILGEKPIGAIRHEDHF